MGDILLPYNRYIHCTTFTRVGMMDFKITPATPDGIKVEAEFWVETWEDLATLMQRLQHADAEV